MTDQKTLEEFREYMKEGRGFRDEVVHHMAVTSVNTHNFLEYVKQCDDDREAQEKRITKVETSQAVHKGVLAAGITAIPFLVSAMDWLKK